MEMSSLAIQMAQSQFGEKVPYNFFLAGVLMASEIILYYPVTYILFILINLLFSIKENQVCRKECTWGMMYFDEHLDSLYLVLYVFCGSCENLIVHQHKVSPLRRRKEQRIFFPPPNPTLPLPFLSSSFPSVFFSSLTFIFLPVLLTIL